MLTLDEYSERPIRFQLYSPVAFSNHTAASISSGKVSVSNDKKERPSLKNHEARKSEINHFPNDSGTRNVLRYFRLWDGLANGFTNISLQCKSFIATQVSFSYNITPDSSNHLPEDTSSSHQHIMEVPGDKLIAAWRLMSLGKSKIQIDATSRCKFQFKPTPYPQ